MVTLTVIFALIALRGFQSRGAAAGIRGLAIALLPAAAWLTGSRQMFTDLVDVVVDWVRTTVLTNQVWGGIAAFSAAVLLWLIGTRMRSAAVARERATKREPGGSGQSSVGTRAPAQVSPSSQGSAPTAPITPADDLGDVEDILRRRGIS